MKRGSIHIDARNTQSSEAGDLITGSTESRVIPLYDKGKITRLSFLAWLVLVWICAIGCVAGASSMFARRSKFTLSSQTVQLPAGFTSISGPGDIYALMVTVLITACSESRGFIHDAF